MKNKGDLMKLVYTEEELRNIDSAIPIQAWETHMPVCHVMNYNGDNGAFGTLENLFIIAKGRRIDTSEYEHLNYNGIIKTKNYEDM